LTNEFEDWDSIDETVAVKGYQFPDTVMIRDLDDPANGNGLFDLEIVDVTCDNKNVDDPKELFNIRITSDDDSLVNKVAYFLAAEDFRDKWGVYEITVEVYSLN